MRNQVLFVAVFVALSGCTSLSSRTPSGSTASPFRPDGAPVQSFPVSESPLFQTREPLLVGLRAEFERIHRANSGGNWTGEDRSSPNFWSEGILVESLKVDKPLKAKVRARGMSSADDQDFPKLRVEIEDAENLSGTSFKGARNFRINTHVSTHPKSAYTGMGRLNDERAPYREALGFEIAEAMGLPTPSIRRARIAYEDTGIQERFERKALLIETDKKTGERYGAKALTLDEFLGGEEGPSKIATRLAANFFIFHILIGNDDTGLRIKNESPMATEFYRPLFNTTVFQLASGAQFPLIYDLDLSSLMRAAPPPNAKMEQSLPALGVPGGDIERKLLSLAKLRSRLTKAEFEQGIKDFLASEVRIRKAILAATVDEEGRAHALRQVDFLKAAGTQLQQLPMLGRVGVRLFAEPSMKTDLLRQLPASEGPGFLPPGYPIKVLEKKGKIAKIAVADYSFYLKDFRQSVGYVSVEELGSIGYELAPDLIGHVDERDMAGGG